MLLSDLLTFTIDDNSDYLLSTRYPRRREHSRTLQWANRQTQPSVSYCWQCIL